MDPDSHTGNASTTSQRAEEDPQDGESGCLSGMQNHHSQAELDHKTSTTVQSELSFQVSESQNEPEQSCPQQNQELGPSQDCTTQTPLCLESEKIKLEEEQTEPLTVIPTTFNEHNQGKHELCISKSIEKQNQEPHTPECGCPSKQQNQNQPCDICRNKDICCPPEKQNLLQPHQDSQLPSGKHTQDLSSSEEQLNQGSCELHKTQQIRYPDHIPEKQNNNKDGGLLFEDTLDKDQLSYEQPTDVDISLLHPKEENKNLCDPVHYTLNQVQGSSSSQDLKNLDHTPSSKDQYVNIEQENQGLIDLENKQNQIYYFQKEDVRSFKHLESENLLFLDQQNQDLKTSEKQVKLEFDSFPLDPQNQANDSEHQEKHDSPSIQVLQNQHPCSISLDQQNQIQQDSERQQKFNCGPVLFGLKNEEAPEHLAKQDSLSLQDLPNHEPVPCLLLEQQTQGLCTSEKHLTQTCGSSSLDLQNQECPQHEEKQTSKSVQDLENQDSCPPSLDHQNQDHPTAGDTGDTQNCDPSFLVLQIEDSDPLPEHHGKQDDINAELKTQQPLILAENQDSTSLQVLPVSDNSTTSPSMTSPTSTQFGDDVQPIAQVPSTDEPKLCGFLQKQGGPLRAWKQRWFTYEEKKNQLFYYRTPQDVMPLGHVDLSSATFTYPLKAEDGTFHIKTLERTFVLKAVTQELMLYWLQQLQVKRWQHRQNASCTETETKINNNNSADDFLPLLKSPLGLVGEEAANAQSQRTPLTNMSIKHPLIELQNSVHFLRKRSSQELNQSVFHIETPGSPKSARSDPPASRTPVESLPSPALSPDPTEGKTLPFLTDTRSKKNRKSSSSTMSALRRDTLSSSSDRMSRIQQEKQMLMEEVKAQKELVWILHKALEAAQLEKRACTEFLAEENEQKRLELLRHRERHSADLQRKLEEANMEAELLKKSLTEKDTQVAELQDMVRMMTEKNNAKQEVIIKLSNQMTTCLSNQQPSPAGGTPNSDTLKRLRQENENLKDDIEAYKMQNKFLNSEIYQLTRLWRKSSEQERSLMVKCAYLEASNCQVESRYLSVLKRLQEIKTLDPNQRQAVHKMIEDALKGELKSVAKVNTTRDHDEYGFKIIPDYEVEDMKLLAKIQALEIRSHNLLQQDTVERPLLTRWAQYLAGRSNDDLCASPELKSLLRSGVPQEYRQRVWSWMVQTRTGSIRDRHPQHYQQLCEKSQTCQSPAFRQIQLDLHRTLTTNQRFSSPSSPAHQQLCRILQAFSWHNPAIGYCQGLNRLAAIALLVLQNEEESFWCLVTVVESIMPQEYYTKNLLSSQADQRVLKDFLLDKLPRLASHFEEYSIDVSLVTFNWFLVVFVENLPSDILLPLWDAFLYEGSKVMFRYALALLKYKENDILKIHDSVEIHQYLRFFTKTITDSRKLISIAFNDLNPFPGRLLKNRRAFHMERLQAELRELEEQQKEFVTESAERKDKDLDTMVSEDDEDL